MTIGIWGDSITFGSHDEEGLGWVGRLRQSLPNDESCQLYNFGVCGETTADLNKRFSIEAEAIGPDKIIFAVGTNDSKFPQDLGVNKVAPADFKNNLRTLIKQAHSYTDNITFVGLTKTDDRWRTVTDSRFFNEEIERYDKLIKETAKENDCAFISMFELVDPKTELADGLHPNANGYKKMFERVKTEWKL